MDSSRIHTLIFFAKPYLQFDNHFFKMRMLLYSFTVESLVFQLFRLLASIGPLFGTVQIQENFFTGNQMRWNQVLSYCAVSVLLLFNCTPPDKVGFPGALAADPGCLGKVVPVIPGAQGFGIYTPAGRCGQIIKVSNLNDSGQGSLRQALRTEGPRIVVFEVSGVIRLRDEIEIIHPNLTIAGQTAPSPGIIVIGAGIYINARDVLMQHISIFPGDEPGDPDYDNRDGISIGKVGVDVSNVVIDHVSVGWATDENIDVIDDTDNITLRHILNVEPIVRTRSLNRNAGFALLTYGEGKLDVQGSFFGHVRQRAPLSRIGNLVFANNVLYDRGQSWIVLGNANGSGNPNESVSNTAIIGNVFIEGNSLSSSTEDLPITITKKAMLNKGSLLYVKDNYWSARPNSEQWDMVKNEPSYVKVNNELDILDGFQIKSGKDNIISWVIENVGSRPADRSEIDKRALRNFNSRNGRLLNCVSGCSSSAGGWPQFSKSKITLNIPERPHDDDDDDGYSNVEEWLHELAARLELQR